MSSILVIEDDQGILELISTALKRFGHCVEEAADGREGIAKFDRGDFDVVITDLRMPRVDGLGVARHVRDSARRRVPIIGMSGTPWLIEGAGFDQVLSKPFALNTLVETVAALDRPLAFAPALA
jgi:DNA-binding response OmpR family regulator